MSELKYSYHEERGEFVASLTDEMGNVIWSVRYPDYYEDDETGELIQCSTIFDDGYMKNPDDINGLYHYLLDMGIIADDDEIVRISGYAMGGGIPEGYHQMPDGTIMPDSAHMKQGGRLEDRIKKRLEKNFELPIEMVVYVPSTEKANQTIGKRDFTKRVDEVQEFLAKTFGGFSATNVEGGYVSDEKGLIQEDVVKVTAFAQVQDFEKKFDELINKIKYWAGEWGQESIGFEFEGDLYYIEKDASFNDGGLTGEYAHKAYKGYYFPEDMYEVYVTAETPEKEKKFFRSVIAARSFEQAEDLTINRLTKKYPDYDFEIMDTELVEEEFRMGGSVNSADRWVRNVQQIREDVSEIKLKDGTTIKGEKLKKVMAEGGTTLEKYRVRLSWIDSDFNVDGKPATTLAFVEVTAEDKDDAIKKAVELANKKNADYFTEHNIGKLTSDNAVSVKELWSAMKNGGEVSESYKESEKHAIDHATSYNESAYIIYDGDEYTVGTKEDADYIKEEKKTNKQLAKYKIYAEVTKDGVVNKMKEGGTTNLRYKDENVDAKIKVGRNYVDIISWNPTDSIENTESSLEKISNDYSDKKIIAEDVGEYGDKEYKFWDSMASKDLVYGFTDIEGRLHVHRFEDGGTIDTTFVHPKSYEGYYADGGETKSKYDILAYNVKLNRNKEKYTIQEKRIQVVETFEDAIEKAKEELKSDNFNDDSYADVLGAKRAKVYKSGSVKTFDRGGDVGGYYKDGAYLNTDTELKSVMPNINTSKKRLDEVKDFNRLKVSSKIDELVRMVEDAKAKGKKPEFVDLCKISIPKTNIYCNGNIGIDRNDMPQFKGSAKPNSLADQLPKNPMSGNVDTEEFFKLLLDKKGINLNSGKNGDGIEVDPSVLRATQRNMVADKVIEMYAYLEKDPTNPFLTSPIFVSNDGYVLDGHHRWAAIVTYNTKHPDSPIPMKVNIIDMPIKELVKLANEFSDAIGIEKKAAVTGKMANGGETKFIDKVNAIKKHLLEMKYVPKAVQKDYGKVFSPEEAEDSARRIAGAMRKKEMMSDGGLVKIKWSDADFGDSARVIAENKMGLILKAYGQRFHLKFADGKEKTYSANELEFYKEKEMESGGEMESNRMMRGDKKLKYGITYQTITPESAEHGDYDDAGWEVEEQVEDLSEILKIANNYGIYEPSSSRIMGGEWWSSVDPSGTRSYYEKGEETYYSLHISHLDGTDLTKEETEFVTEKLKSGRKLDWDNEDNEWWAKGGFTTHPSLIGKYYITDDNNSYYLGDDGWVEDSTLASIFDSEDSANEAIDNLPTNSTYTINKIDSSQSYAGGGDTNKRFIYEFHFKENERSKVFKNSGSSMVGSDTHEMRKAVDNQAKNLKNSFGWHEVKVVKVPIMADGGETTKFRKVRTLAEAKKDPRVDDIFYEMGNIDPDKKDWWIYLKEGYECRSMECGTIHEQTLKEVLHLLNTDVVKKTDYEKGGETKEKYWIQKAIKKEGSLRETAKREGLIKGEEKLSLTDIKKLKKGSTKTAQRARLAETLKKLRAKK